MEFTWEDALKSGGASATVIAIAGIAYKIASKFCGHRIRSECCGRESTIGVSVETVEPRPTPAGPRPSLEPPPTARPSPVIIAVTPAPEAAAPPSIQI